MPIVVGGFRDEASFRRGGVAPSCAPTCSAAACSAPASRRSRWTSAAPSTRRLARARRRRVVAGSVTRLADGRFDVRYKLWDAVRNEQLLGQSKVVLAGRPAPGRAPRGRRDLPSSPASAACSPPASPTWCAGGRRHTLHVTDADGEGGQVALASPEPIISPAWSPDGANWPMCPSRRRRPWSGCRTCSPASAAAGQLPRLQQRAGLVARRARAGRHAVAAGCAAVRDARAKAARRAADQQQCHRHRGRLQPRRPQVYFVSDRGGGPQIYRVPAGGGNPERVTFAGSYNISPAISPDGKLLAYVARQGNGAFKLMTLDLDERRRPVRLLTDTSDDESPSFAPNGRLIVYTSREQGATC
jgi:TolB protein